VCADCNEPNPRYCSVSFGAFLCDECYGSHRAVGAHVSKTRSLALDEWSAEEVGRMEGGNAAVNREYEATMPVGAKRRSKEYSSRDQRNWFIKQKYEHRKWFVAHKGGELPQQEMAEKAKKKKKPAASVAATSDSFADDFGDLLNLSTPAMHSTSSSGTHASSNDSAWDPFGPSNTGVEQQPQGCLTAEASGGWGVRHSYVQQPGTSGVGGLAGGMGMQQQQQQQQYAVPEAL